ncbi:hypothetical protein EYZ11_001310 [Aspergillus tanneri]|uniref:Uncharacterized protein n=1 Tax=Aspergillus tanneri TaxID=1220188 RepID=A0A4S3JUY2_9EURO|nr:hypothetical protein EYZ11_001310 [Aspergillus tanneri]
MAASFKGNHFSAGELTMKIEFHWIRLVPAIPLRRCYVLKLQACKDASLASVRKLGRCQGDNHAFLLPQDDDSTD